ncbi:MAG TPA: hypothetical protein VGX92_08555 [Pyrinomonadaceae bacterium]|jgi:hypothetical protein|nr:hypothetical protein [Pyrinomonadaceae bacterium]
MTEIGIGLLFAFWFVLAYLLISKLFGPDDQGQTRWREILRPSASAGRSIGAKKPQLFLSASELSEHHSQSKSGSSSGTER